MWRLAVAEVQRLVQLTDLHLLADPEALFKGAYTRQRFLTALQKAKELEPDLLVLTGDLAQDEALPTYQWLAAQLNASQMTWQWLPGNHDAPDLMARWSPPTFAGELAGWQLLGLNSRQPESAAGWLDATELERLEQAVQQQRPLVIALHHHPLAVGSAWMDALALQNSDAFWQRLQAAQQPVVVICGHVHQQQHWQQQQVAVFSTPATAIQFAPHKETFELDLESPPALRWLDLSSKGHYATDVIGIE